MKKSPAILLFIMAGIFMIGLPQIARAATYEICIKVKVRHTDSGLTHPTGASEDQWTNTNHVAGTDVRARGFLVHLDHPGTGWSQFIYTHYSTGCLTFSHSSSSGYTVSIFGQGRDSANNRVRIHDAGTSSSSWSPGNTALEQYTNQSLSSSSTNYYVLDGVIDDTWTTIASAAFGLYRYHNGNSNKTISIGFDNGGCGNSGSILGNSENYIESNDAHLYRIGRCSGSSTNSRRKFTITHELGHCLARLYYGYDGDDGPRNQTYDPVVTPNNPGDCLNVSGYGMLSLEFGSQAFKEGFADFYSAKIWNNKDTNGVYSRSGETYSLYHWNPNGSGADTIGGVVNNHCGSHVLSVTTRNDFLLDGLRDWNQIDGQ